MVIEGVYPYLSIKFIFYVKISSFPKHIQDVFKMCSRCRQVFLKTCLRKRLQDILEPI